MMDLQFKGKGELAAGRLPPVRAYLLRFMPRSSHAAIIVGAEHPGNVYPFEPSVQRREIGSRSARGT